MASVNYQTKASFTGFGFPETVMRRTKAVKKRKLVAAGFLALDVVFGLEDAAPQFYAGGTSGNIATGLAYLGWNSLPIGRLADDVAGDVVRKDLERWGVETRLLGLAPLAAA